MDRSVRLSVIVIFHDMRREAERTLYSLSPHYQRGVDSEDYEVIAIENGSNIRIGDPDLSRFGPNFRYHFHETDSVSPVAAINRGLQMAQHDVLGVIIDGARMASPGLIGRTIDAASRYPGALIGALGWLLGPDQAQYGGAEGYDTAVEDALLEEADWHAHGYRLFAISSLCPSSAYGIKGGMPPELSYIAAAREDFAAIGGYDERFTSPGGGFVNYDIVERLLEHTVQKPVLLAGEGTFHQIHGGVTTNAAGDNLPHADFAAEYFAIKGRQFQPPEKALPRYFGPVPAEAQAFVAPLYKRLRRVGGAIAARHATSSLALFRKLTRG